MVLLLALLVQEPHRPLSLEELARAGPFRGTARVEAVDVRRDPDTGAVYTDARLRILETWGEPFPPEVVLTQVGGELDGLRSAAVGWNYALAPGAAVAFFAKHWKGPYFAVVGMRQGLFHLDGLRAVPDLDRESPGLKLDELRSRVLGGTPPRSAEPPPAEDVVPPAPSSPSPARPESGGRAFFVLAAILGLAAVAVRFLRKR